MSGGRPSVAEPIFLGFPGGSDGKASAYNVGAKGTVEDTFFFRLTCSVALWGGREGCCKQITLACARSASATLGLPPLMARVASLPTLLGL